MPSDDNSEAIATLEDLQRRLGGLKDFDTRAAPLVAQELEKQLLAQIAEGVEPEGNPWAPTRKGERPLKNAAEALEVKALGDVVIARLAGPTALHNLGHAAGGIRRQILPSRQMPQKLIAAIEYALAHAMIDELKG